MKLKENTENLLISGGEHMENKKTEHVLKTENGDIRYWLYQKGQSDRWLVLLPGLSADHNLFEKQVEHFKGKYNILVWDAPGHGHSRPFELVYSVADKAKWLREILLAEKIRKPVLIGQSMGGYVSQALMELYPDVPGGFISIDSAPLQKKYMRNWEIWMLKHTKLLYSMYPWELLKKKGAEGCAESHYGYQLMYDMMNRYSKDEYCSLVSHGYRILAEAIEKDLKYEITCPAVLICGEKDQAGYTKKYNMEWTKQSGLPIRYIPGAGHNSNTDQPDQVNKIIDDFLNHLL